MVSFLHLRLPHISLVHALKCMFCLTRLKWKPADENTVDFKIFVKTVNGKLEFHIGILVTNQQHQEFGALQLEPERREEWGINPPDGRIVECRYDPEWPNHWRFSRWRDDKLTANHISVYEKIMQSIADNVTEEQVLNIDVVD
jgi:mRNA guanylyltransferase